MELTELTRFSRVLMLQGPIGPLFLRLQSYLRSRGAEVRKVNFNGGDVLFHPNAHYCYRGALAEWAGAFAAYLDEFEPSVVLLFGDCRPYHRDAIQVCTARGLPVLVFEEGYFRPDYLTVEPGGANGNSDLVRLRPEDLESEIDTWKVPKPAAARATIRGPACVAYYLACRLAWPVFARYVHHRKLSVTSEALAWMRWGVRRLRDAINGRSDQLATLCETHLRKRYFLAAMQVHYDSQVVYHSPHGSVRRFIEHVLTSFADHALPDDHLVFKPHPHDIGYQDFGVLVHQLAARMGIRHRVHYLQWAHMPTLLKNAKGLVTLNSTSGISSLHHGTPVKVLGKAVYDLKGLTHQGSLDEFWRRPEPVDDSLYERYRSFVVRTRQINLDVLGNGLKRLD